MSASGRDGMRTSSDSFPFVLALAAFVLMFLGQATYERLLDALIVEQVEPWFGGIAAEVIERLSAVAVAGALALYVTGGLYLTCGGNSPGGPPAWPTDRSNRLRRPARSVTSGSTTPFAESSWDAGILSP